MSGPPREPEGFAPRIFVTESVPWSNTRLNKEQARLRLRSGGPEGRVTFERVFDERDTRVVRLFINTVEDAVTGADDVPFDVDIVDERPQ